MRLRFATKSFFGSLLVAVVLEAVVFVLRHALNGLLML